MNPTHSIQPTNGNSVAAAILDRTSDIQKVERTTPAPAVSQGSARPAGYGLPCARCRTYYTADLTACPVCNSTERVSPTAAAARATQTQMEPFADSIALEEERERFLREFKSQVYASHMQINAATSFRCGMESNHRDGFEPAAICQACYDRLQERVDVMEAALHIDLKEAAQIVYDAVWADPSDSNKTYQNAAHALLSELRRRAGIPTVLGPLQPLQH
jgi:hypothetical protein